MINNDTDFDPARTRLALRSRVQIANFLQLKAAEQLHRCLVHDVPWTLADRIDGHSRITSNQDYLAMTAAERSERMSKAYIRAQHEFQFVYDSYMMVTATKEGRDPGLLLHRVLEFLNTPEYLQFMRWLTKDDSIGAASAQATRYRPGHFLTGHDDEDKKENRAFAYVINLTRSWHPDWGGLLQFQDASGGVIDSFLPRWNSLSIFRVPQSHSVSLVSPWAGEDRLAITGWLLSR